MTEKPSSSPAGPTEGDGKRKDTITGDRIRKYLDTTRIALDRLRIAPPDPSHLRTMAEDALSMARCYYEDALHFHHRGDIVNAFAAVNYAHGWLDAGARFGLFDVDGDHRLFTLSA